MSNYREIERAVQEQTENILFLYLQDEHGAPVMGVKCRIWGGPPPAGDPPYFVDDDPDNPNRQTDARGKFQFIVSAGPVSERADFFVVPVDAEDRSLSDPVAFTFWPDQAMWITATLAREREAALPPPPSFPEVEESPEPWQATAPQPPPETGPEEQFEPAPAPAKPLAHYLLLGAPDAPGTLTNLVLALDYVVGFAPVAGFKVEEALHAAHVTIVGDERAVSAEAEAQLRAAGCTVTRLAAADSYALESLLRERVRSGIP